jgi:mycofactocin precursor
MTDEENLKESQTDEQEDTRQDEIFIIKEIEVEEMAIDGICGVY